mmetsp:Transcript_36254/g.82621  ORF Transcript_36254/g.82621 Transcript_36254/m.82621 type:complete len:387 (+) Transcript_36254:23-1183(+)
MAAAHSEEWLKRDPTALILFPIPGPTAPNHQFPSGVVKQFDEDSVKALEEASTHRDAMCGAMKIAENPDALVKAIKAYLPHCIALNAALPATGATTTFGWKSGLYNKSYEASLLYEVAFSHVALALALHNQAVAVIAGASMTLEEFDLPSKTAAAALCQAVGVLEFVEKVVAQSGNPAATLFPESNPNVISAFKSIFLAEAQMIAIAKAHLRSTSPGLIAKLCAQVSAGMTAAKDNLAVGKGTPVETDIYLQVYCEGASFLYRILSQKYSALHAYNDLSYGHALGHLQVAQRVGKQWETFRKAQWASYFKGPLVSVTDAELTFVAQINDALATENTKVAKDRVTPEDELPPVPPQVLVAPTAWTPITPAFSTLQPRAPGQWGCCLQ